MTPRQLYIGGFGLGLVGSLATVAALLLAGATAIGVIALGTTLTFVLGLRSALEEDTVERDQLLAYRVGNWVGAVVAVGLGLVMLAVGGASLVWFG